MTRPFEMNRRDVEVLLEFCDDVRVLDDRGVTLLAAQPSTSTPKLATTVRTSCR